MNELQVRLCPVDQLVPYQKNADTIHPSTLELMHELGILETLLKQLHQKLRELRAHIGNMEVVMADVSRLPTQCPFVALMPQWDFLTFLAEQALR